MTSKAMSFKAKIKNYAKEKNITAQVVLQNYMFERFLARLAVSEYSDKFVIKGGMLISSIVGLDTRSTMDLDTTLRNLPLTVEKISEAIKHICSINLNDDITFEISSLAPIRKDDIYGGFCARFNAVFDTIITPLSVDISTGDVITPAAVKYEFSSLFDEDFHISLWGYNIETVLAEKTETVLNRGILNTRPRDYYDIYILGTTQKFDYNTFRDALKATANHRGSIESISDFSSILNTLSTSNILIDQWKKYQKKFKFANDISWEMIISVLTKLTEGLQL